MYLLLNGSVRFVAGNAEKNTHNNLILANQPGPNMKAVIQKADNRITCKHCGKQKRVKSSKAVYCGDACKNAAKYARSNGLEAKREVKGKNSAFMFWMAKECRRAGTLQILEGHTVESLGQLYGVYKFNSRANTRGGHTEKFHLCHLSPVAGEKTIGKLTAANLVVAQALANFSWGNKDMNVGECISKGALEDKYAVESDAPLAALSSRIIVYIGKAIFAEFVKVSKVKSAEFVELQHWFEENEIFIKDIHKQSTQKLKELKAAYLKDNVISITRKSYKAPLGGMTAVEVYAHELARFSADPAAVKLVERLAGLVGEGETFADIYLEVPAATERKIERICFDWLHGAVDNLHLAIYKLVHVHIQKAA